MEEYLPSARRNIIKMLSASQLAWIETITDEFFSAPSERINIELMLEAHAVAIDKYLQNRSDRNTLLCNYVLKILELGRQETNELSVDYLTQSDIDFFLHHNIPLSKVFDATGMRKKEWQPKMREVGAWVAVGVNPCGEEGHTMRTRAGHCAACNTANLSFMRRHDSPGYVYVAMSENGNLIKVGTTINLDERETNLNSYAYGEQKDWQIHFSQHCSKAGWVETMVHQDLAEHRTRGCYYRDDRLIECYELFDCTLDEAIASLTEHARLSPPE